MVASQLAQPSRSVSNPSSSPYDLLQPANRALPPTPPSLPQLFVPPLPSFTSFRQLTLSLFSEHSRGVQDPVAAPGRAGQDVREGLQLGVRRRKEDVEERGHQGPAARTRNSCEYIELLGKVMREAEG